MTEIDGTTNVPLKRCHRGDRCLNPNGAILPATLEYFYRDAHKPDGLYYICKICKANDERTEHLRKDILPDGHKRCQSRHKCVHPEGDILPASHEYFYASSSIKSGLNSYCKCCTKEKLKRYYQENKERVIARVRLYEISNREFISNRRRELRIKNAEKEKARSKRYYQKNYHNLAPKYLAYQKEWRRKNPAKYKAQKYRRRENIQSLAESFSNEDWANCLHYWDNRCAYCGNQQGLLFAFRITADHWIPLTNTNCPGTIAGNMLPCCQSCNSSKSDNDPIKWLTEKYGGKKASQKIAAIMRYFERVSH